MSNHLKEIVEQIQKIAQVPDRSKGPRARTPAPAASTGGGQGGPRAKSTSEVPQRGAKTPTPTAPTAPKSQTGGGDAVSNAGVKEMQRKLMNLAKQVTSQINIKDLAKDMSSRTPVQPSREGVEAAGRNSFGDFVAKNYLRKSDVPGVEFDPSESKKQMSEKQPSTPTRMGVIMDTMSRVGNPKMGEVFDDGAWGPRTNASLRNAYAFAYAMLKLAADFEVPIKSYSEQQLKEFKVPAKETDLSVWDRIKLAPTMSQHIDGITQMFNEIKEGILENPQHQTFIEGAPYATYNKSKPAGPPGTPEAQQQAAMLTSQEANEIHAVFPQFTVGFAGPDGQVQQRNLIITDLLTLQSLDAWRKKNGVSISIPEIIKQVRNQVSLLPDEYTPEQDSAWSQKNWEEEKERAEAIRKGKSPEASNSVQLSARTGK